jgi:hypothetical protein
MSDSPISTSSEATPNLDLLDPETFSVPSSSNASSSVDYSALCVNLLLKYANFHGFHNVSVGESGKNALLDILDEVHLTGLEMFSNWMFISNWAFQSGLSTEQKQNWYSGAPVVLDQALVEACWASFQLFRNVH